MRQNARERQGSLHSPAGKEFLGESDQLCSEVTKRCLKDALDFGN